MNLRKLIFTNNRCYLSGKKMIPKGIMVHSTGANNPWLSRYVGPDDGILGENTYGNHWNQYMSREVCVHGFIGKLANGTVATYQTLPWDMVGWHSGAGNKGSLRNANNTGYIGFEICEDDLTDASYFNKVYKEAVELCAYLCKLYNIKPEKPYLICHSEGHALGIASNHGDVMHWFPKHGKSMDTFRKDVAKLINSNKKPTTLPNTQPDPELYRVGTNWSNGKCIGQIGAYSTLENAIKMCTSSYKVFNNDGKVIYPTSTTIVNTSNNSSTETLIYQYLADNTELNCAAISGILANLKHESAFKSINLQNSYEKSLGYTDESYTSAVDLGRYSNFVRDAAGYGLAQWTYWTRKQGLLEYAKSKNTSIGDYKMQLEYLIKELKSYSKVWKTLTTCKNDESGAYDCGYVFCYDFESPASKSTSAVTRGNSAKTYFKKYNKSKPSKPSKNTKPSNDKLNESVTTAKTYVLKTSTAGYTSAANAKNRRNPQDTLKAGTYYIYNKYPNGYSGMFNITTDKSGKTPGSWINPTKEKIWTPKKGDKVIVNGYVTEYGDGTGDKDKFSNETMYITEVLNSKDYSNYIGVAYKKGGTRYGWVKRSTIKKA